MYPPWFLTSFDFVLHNYCLWKSIYSFLVSSAKEPPIYLQCCGPPSQHVRTHDIATTSWCHTLLLHHGCGTIATTVTHSVLACMTAHKCEWLGHEQSSSFGIANFVRDEGRGRPHAWDRAVRGESRPLIKLGRRTRVDIKATLEPYARTSILVFMIY
jgi:hypothetical protein